MAIKLTPLPYGPDALAPAISAETLHVHHGKHHRHYVDEVNAAIADSPLASAPLETVIAAAREQGDTRLFNNAAQAWNHGFYWHSLTPKPAKPSATLALAVARDLGSADGLAEQLAQQGAAHFGSGWVWLVSDNGQLSVEQTHDAETFADSAKIPLLVIDLWEHAYYLDSRNQRAAYLKAVTGRHLDWAFASAIYDSGQRWVYSA